MFCLCLRQFLPPCLSLSLPLYLFLYLAACRLRIVTCSGVWFPWRCRMRVSAELPSKQSKEPTRRRDSKQAREQTSKHASKHAKRLPSPFPHCFHLSLAAHLPRESRLLPASFQPFATNPFHALSLPPPVPPTFSLSLSRSLSLSLSIPRSLSPSSCHLGWGMVPVAV